MAHVDYLKKFWNILSQPGCSSLRSAHYHYVRSPLSGRTMLYEGEYTRTGFVLTPRILPTESRQQAAPLRPGPGLSCLSYTGRVTPYGYPNSYLLFVLSVLTAWRQDGIM